MDETKFAALMVKLQAASWVISNTLSNTILFSSRINDQKVRLYNMENSPIYINSLRLDLTSEQIETILVFVNQLVDDHSSEIQAARVEKNQSMTTAFNKILE